MTYVGWDGREYEDPERAAMQERPPRSSRSEIRNPVLALPAAEKILALEPECRKALAELLRDLGADANERAETSWRKGKGPMAAYWKAAGVYARHIARALERG